MTNADRIRSMTDEELVSIIDCPYGIYPIEDCKKPICWSCKMEWLKEEVNDKKQLIESKVLKAMRRELGRYTAEMEEDNG